MAQSDSGRAFFFSDEIRPIAIYEKCDRRIRKWLGTRNPFRIERMKKQRDLAFY